MLRDKIFLIIALALEAIAKSLDVEGMLFEGEYRFTKQMVADFYDVDVSTIDRYLSIYAEELKYNGYILSKVSS